MTQAFCYQGYMLETIVLVDSSVGLEDVRHPTAVFFLQTQDHREASSSYHLLVFPDDCPFALSRIYNCVYEAGIGEN